MKKIALALSAIALSAAAATAADDPIGVRKALMQATGASAGTASAMMKGDLDYNPAVAKASIATMAAVAKAYGDYFPEGSDMGADTTAAPKIWEDAAGFQEALAKFQADTSAAMQASGKDGPADLDAFKAAMGPVLANCKSCHEGFRVKK
ncbi:MAG: cytochrome C signal peptide protein [Phyllobacteriaceae bacterium]|nr:cytochrome C signal peptide protein [Phyllobacteriaceae bacterium]MBA92857.1 cytochrome C signal peptide protein [Phyllobacteriaceae bacterium]